jgi:hypothetical protein
MTPSRRGVSNRQWRPIERAGEGRYKQAWGPHVASASESIFIGSVNWWPLTRGGERAHAVKEDASQWEWLSPWAGEGRKMQGPVAMRVSLLWAAAATSICLAASGRSAPDPKNRLLVSGKTDCSWPGSIHDRPWQKPDLVWAWKVRHLLISETEVPGLDATQDVFAEPSCY